METEALSVALDVVASVGTFVRRIRNEVTSEDVLNKSDGSPVTIADLAAQSLVVHRLEQDEQLPRLPICGEESADVLRDPGNTRLRARVCELVRSEEPGLADADVIDLLDRGSFRPEPGSHSTHWLCDPIDGTKRYLSGHRYSCCLGLVVEGQLRAGAIGCPDLAGGSDGSLVESDTRGSLFGTRVGGGAFRIEPLAMGSRGERVALRLPATLRENKSLLVARSVGGSTLGPRLRDHLVEAGFDPMPVNIDNQCKYAALVTGRVDVLFQYGDDGDSKCAWDFAPGVLLATEAGAKVLDRNGEEFDFSRGSMLQGNRGLRACRPELMELLLSVR